MDLIINLLHKFDTSSSWQLIKHLLCTKVHLQFVMYKYISNASLKSFTINIYMGLAKLAEADVFPICTQVRIPLLII